MNDQLYMMRAIDLARLAEGHTSPNPMVGAVVVGADGQILGEGYHHRAGEAHAEVNAIRAVDDHATLSSSVIYVTLEPCSHYGKTPPCADLIIESGIRRVVVGCVDPYEKVSGRGIEKLRAAGIEVTVGVLQSECRELNKRFITAQTLDRPYIILKWAQSADGFLDIERAPTTAPAWFTGEAARKMVHLWRAEEDAIMVGRKTAELDNPSLTVRAVAGRNPIRIVLDQNGVLSDNLHLFDGAAQTIVYTAQKHVRTNCEMEILDYSQPIVSQILSSLNQRGIQSLIVEGGGMLLNSFIDSDLWDEARIFTSAHPVAHYYPAIGNIKGVAAPKLSKTADYQHQEVQLEQARLDVFSRRVW